MPGLNPLQNAQPRQQIPNEAPRYFSPFFEQPAKPPPVSIWQPPNVELPRRSKAPTHRPRSPPQIPTAGTWSRRNSGDAKAAHKGLFQPRQKSSGDEMMWLGAVTGFSLPEPAPPKEHGSLRSKLVRKPEEIPSQASSATGPKATEANRKKEEQARAREKRLEEWATKKKPNASGSPAGMAIPIPQPIESRLRPRKKLYTPLPQPEQAALISNRPNAIHRPHLPNLGDGSYAPEKPFLPQPIETVKRSNRPRQSPKRIESEEEETLWMGLPQPIETIRRANRKSKLNKMVSADERDQLPSVENDKDSTEPRSKSTDRPQQNPSETQTKETAEKKGTLPGPIETTGQSNRPVKILPEPTGTTRRSNRPLETKSEILPKPLETNSRLIRPVGKGILPEPIETAKRCDRSAGTSEVLPTPIEFVGRSNLPTPTLIQADEPPTLTTSFFGSEIQPQPVETSLRSHRPISARPLIPQFVESSMRSSRMRIPYTHMHLELPQPISVSRWTSRSPGLRRESTSHEPTSPGVHPFSRNGDRNRRKMHKFAPPAADHVWHLGEPVDSAPTSPVDSADDSTSPSRCPSLSSSPTSCAASMAWEVPLRSSKGGGIQGGRESLDEGFSVYPLALERKFDKEEIVLGDGGKEGVEYPFTVVIEECMAEHATSTSRGGLGPRIESSETIRPKLRTVGTEPLIKDAEELRKTNDRSDFLICYSPKFAMFQRPLHLPTPGPGGDEYNYKRKFHIPSAGMWEPPAVRQDPGVSQRSPTPPNSVRSTIPRTISSNGSPTAPSHMWGSHLSGPSPGYTAASLPPAKRRENTAKEVTPDFVEDVYRYLGLQFENVAAKFDYEIASCIGISVILVKRDRRAALTKYCEKWVQENPDLETGAGRKGGLW